MASGSIAVGPSELYLGLLKGTISPEEYAKRARKRIQEESRRPPRASTGALPKRA